MKMFSSAIMAATLILSAAQGAHARCSKDTDCKGLRVCERGLCVSPQATTATPISTTAATSTTRTLISAPMHEPTASQTPRPRNWFSGYISLAGLSSFRSWGGYKIADTDVDLSLSSTGIGGVHLAGYYVISDSFHIGAYISYVAGEEIAEYHRQLFKSENSNLGSGLSLKLGKRVSERIWLGLALDLGANYITRGESAEGTIGVQAFPRLEIDVMAVDERGFKLGLTASIGAMIEPIAVGENSTLTIANDHAPRDYRTWNVRMGMLIGVVFGGGSV